MRLKVVNLSVRSISTFDVVGIVISRDSGPFSIRSIQIATNPNVAGRGRSMVVWLDGRVSAASIICSSSKSAQSKRYFGHFRSGR